MGLSLSTLSWYDRPRNLSASELGSKVAGSMMKNGILIEEKKKKKEKEKKREENEDEDEG